jgi:hypothetical protein
MLDLSGGTLTASGNQAAGGPGGNGGNSSSGGGGSGGVGGQGTGGVYVAGGTLDLGGGTLAASGNRATGGTGGGGGNGFIRGGNGGNGGQGLGGVYVAGTLDLGGGTLTASGNQAAGGTGGAGGTPGGQPGNPGQAVPDGLFIALGGLAGPGTINGDVTNAGTVRPGTATATGGLTLNGDYTQAAAGTLTIRLGGLAAGAGYDQLVVNGTATLGGTLAVTLVNGFQPRRGDQFQPLLFGGGQGPFARYTLGGNEAAFASTFVASVSSFPAALSDADRCAISRSALGFGHYPRQDSNLHKPA